MSCGEADWSMDRIRAYGDLRAQGLSHIEAKTRTVFMDWTQKDIEEEMGLLDGKKLQQIADEAAESDVEEPSVVGRTTLEDVVAKLQELEKRVEVLQHTLRMQSQRF